MDHRSWPLALFCLSLCFGSGLGAGGQWCVARQDASDAALKTVIKNGCGMGGTDCSAIQPGGSCYEPNTLRDHASYVLNQYYQKTGVPKNCDFGGTATLTSTNPSTGNCNYDASGRSPNTPNIPNTPPSPNRPGGSPSTASSAFCSMLLLLASGLLASLHLANYF